MDPDGVTRVTIAAEPNNAEQGDVVFTLDNLSFYASQDQLETMVGAPCDPRDFQVSATGAGSEFVTLTGDALRVYDPAMTYEKLQALLTVSGDVSPSSAGCRRTAGEARGYAGAHLPAGRAARGDHCRPDSRRGSNQGCAG